MGGQLIRKVKRVRASFQLGIGYDAMRANYLVRVTFDGTGAHNTVSVCNLELHGVLKQAGYVNAERHGQWTFSRRDKGEIQTFLTAVKSDLLKP